MNSERDAMMTKMMNYSKCGESKRQMLYWDGELKFNS